MDLNQIKDPAFLKTKNLKELESLTEEIRVFLIDHISETGGHLASNLGVVELSIALHYVFDSPKDTFIFDVSHQAYVHNYSKSNGDSPVSDIFVETSRSDFFNRS